MDNKLLEPVVVHDGCFTYVVTLNNPSAPSWTTTIELVCYRLDQFYFKVEKGDLDLFFLRLSCKKRFAPGELGRVAEKLVAAQKSHFYPTLSLPQDPTSDFDMGPVMDDFELQSVAHELRTECFRRAYRGFFKSSA